MNETYPFIHSFVSLIMPPTTRNGHTTSKHYNQKPNPQVSVYAATFKPLI